MSTRSANSNTSQLIIYLNDDAGTDQRFTNLSQPANLLSDKIREND
ncbi:hypothetical protein I5E65_25085 [Pseudomonas aeruginosa]|nr:hypothetical protein [Pseudomonas aeruginosa]